MRSLAHYTINLFSFFVGLSFCILVITPAGAVPAFSRQTGVQCAGCHVGGYGPQLTAFGRDFKLHGYAIGDSPDFFPISATVIAAYVHTASDVPGGQGEGFDENDNTKIHEASLYYAGRILDGLGAFVEVNYDGLEHHIALHHTDLRFARDFTLDDHQIVGGVSLNNHPGVQDVWNSTPTWSYPYFASELMPSPAAGVILDDALGGQVYGLSGYAMIDDLVYVEIGGYHAFSKSALDALGHGFRNEVDGITPYWRVAVQKSFGDNYVSAGFFGIHAAIYPGFDHTFGTNKFTDWGFDATYQRPIGNDQVTANATFIHEHQDLDSSFASGDAGRMKSSLSTIRLNGSYYVDDTYGFTAAFFDTWGSTDMLRFAPDPVEGSANGSPNSRGYILQFDWTPWGKDDSNMGTLANLRLGIQYTGYTRFNGRSSNYDGFGRDASDNNTVSIFALFAL
ncbi:MAG: cytochrome C [Alphaproteobacteria bacterium]|nr:cytochrome C [Alphaproteobacteria bacterium]